jgi:hypothetical protein
MPPMRPGRGCMGTCKGVTRRGRRPGGASSLRGMPAYASTHSSAMMTATRAVARRDNIRCGFVDSRQTAGRGCAAPRYMHYVQNHAIALL